MKILFHYLTPDSIPFFEEEYPGGHSAVPDFHAAGTVHMLILGGDYVMNSCELTASITAIANAIACNRTADEISLLGVAFTQLGDTLLTIATQKSICKITSSNSDSGKA